MEDLPVNSMFDRKYKLIQPILSGTPSFLPQLFFVIQRRYLICERSSDT